MKALEARWGVSAAAPVVIAAAAGGGGAAAPAAVEEKTTFDVVLKSGRPAEDPGHQGRPRDHGPGPQGGQGPGRRRAEGRQDRRHEGRRREDQEGAGGRRRRRRGQVAGPPRGPLRPSRHAAAPLPGPASIPDDVRRGGAGRRGLQLVTGSRSRPRSVVLGAALACSAVCDASRASRPSRSCELRAAPGVRRSQGTACVCGWSTGSSRGPPFAVYKVGLGGVSPPNPSRARQRPRIGPGSGSLGACGSGLAQVSSVDAGRLAEASGPKNQRGALVVGGLGRGIAAVAHPASGSAERSRHEGSQARGGGGRDERQAATATTR